MHQKALMNALTEEECGRVLCPKTMSAGQIVTAVGEWTISHAQEIEKHVTNVEKPEKKAFQISLKGIKKLDTSGVWLLLKLRNNWRAEGYVVDLVDVRDEHCILFDAISDASRSVLTHPKPAPEPTQPLNKMVRWLAAGIEEVKRILALLGALIIAFGRRLNGLFFGIFGRKTENSQMFRLPALFTHMMRTGLSAVPIIALMSFLIGAIMAQQGAYQLSFYGADVMAVDLVGVLITRDLGVVLTAIMVAGRSGSAYTAEIGSMKMREEIDALKVIGLDPVDILLFPRILGLILVMPLLTVISDFSAILGAQLALWIYIDLSWEIFLDRLQDAVPLTYFLMGIIKAPFMALIIGLIAMSEGLKVAGSSESLSHHTTVAVVKSIFMVIVVDGIFAVISASLGY